MRFDRHKNFISEAERIHIANWFDASIDNKEIFNKGLSRGEWGYELRKTTRQSKNFKYPSVIETIFNRVIKKYKLENWQKQDVNNNSGIICVAIHPGGDTYLHTDPPAQNSLEAVTFNILIQAPEHGGILYIGDPLCHKDLDERELHSYVASKHQHMVTKCEGSKNRYILICRLALLDGVWE